MNTKYLQERKETNEKVNLGVTTRPQIHCRHPILWFVLIVRTSSSPSGQPAVVSWLLRLRQQGAAGRGVAPFGCSPLPAARRRIRPSIQLQPVFSPCQISSQPLGQRRVRASVETSGGASLKAAKAAKAASVHGSPRLTPLGVHQRGHSFSTAPLPHLPLRTHSHLS